MERERIRFKKKGTLLPTTTKNAHFKKRKEKQITHIFHDIFLSSNCTKNTVYVYSRFFLKKKKE